MLMGGIDVDVETVNVSIPEGANVIIGQSHFIKTVEDVYEAVVGAVPQAKFGVAFCEASGPCLIRTDGNDNALKDAAVENAKRIGAGHTFVILIKDAFPINVMSRLKQVQEICTIFCATANPLDVLVARTDRGGGILGVIDGESPKGVEGPEDVEERKALLRKFGYKR